MSDELGFSFDPSGMAAWVAASATPGDTEGTRLFVLGDTDDWTAPAVVILDMPPGYTLFRHAHTCERFEVIVRGSLEVDGELVGPGHVMTAAPGEFYGPHLAGPDGCQTAEVFSNLEGVFRILVEQPDGSVREYDARKGELPPDFEILG
jgi:hypothetical protein